MTDKNGAYGADEPRLYYDIEEWERPMECSDCGAAVHNSDRHDRWHALVDKGDYPAVKDESNG